MRSLRKQFAKIYKKVDPNVKPRTTIKVPKNLPKINPPIKAMGEPKPAKKTQIIIEIKNRKEIRIKLASLRLKK